MNGYNLGNMANELMKYRKLYASPTLKYRRQALEEPQYGENPILEEEKPQYNLAGVSQLATDVTGARQGAQTGVQAPFQAGPTETGKTFGQPMQFPKWLGGGTGVSPDVFAMILGAAGAGIGGEHWTGRLGANMANVAGTMWQQRMQEQSPEAQMARAKLSAFQQLPPEMQQLAMGVPIEALSPELQQRVVDYTSKMEQAKAAADPDYAFKMIKSNVALAMIENPLEFQKLKENLFQTPDWLLNANQLQAKMAIKSMEAEAGQPAALRKQREATAGAMEGLSEYRGAQTRQSEERLQLQQDEFNWRMQQDTLKDPLGKDFSDSLQGHIGKLDTNWDPTVRANTLNTMTVDALNYSERVFRKNPDSSYAASMLQSAFSYNMGELSNQEHLPEAQSKFVVNMDDVLWKKYQQMDWALQQYNAGGGQAYFQLADQLRKEYNVMRKSAEDTSLSLFGSPYKEIVGQAKAGKPIERKQTDKGLLNRLWDTLNYTGTIGKLLGGE